MPRRTVLTARQRAILFALPTDEATLLRHYILTEEDLVHVRRRRRAHNRLGFALQLCALRYPGRLLQPGETIPEPVLTFIGAQLGLNGSELQDYATREATRYQHSAALQQLYGYRPFEGVARDDLRRWLLEAAEQARSNDGLAAALIEELRRQRVIVPTSSTVERLCADALVVAERRVANRIAARLDTDMRRRLLGLLEETIDDKLTRFVWLRQHEVGDNSNAVNQLLDRLDHLNALSIPTHVLDGVPGHRIARLRRQGERYYADGLRDLPDARKLAILAVCAIEWRASVADAVAESHDRIMGKLYRNAERQCAAQIEDQRLAVETTLHAFAEFGHTVLAAREANADVADTIERGFGWERLTQLVQTAFRVVKKIAVDPLDFVTVGYARLRRYTPRLLATLDLKSGPAGAALLRAIDVLRRLNAAGNTGVLPAPPIDFARPKWRDRLRPQAEPARKLWETAVLFALRDALRSGDVWLARSKRYGDMTSNLLPAPSIGKTGKLAVPLDARTWLDERQATLEAALATAGHAASRGLLPNGAIEHGVLRLDKLERSVPPEAEDLVLDLYAQIPPTRITDVLLDVDDAVGFTEAFTHLRTGAPCRDRIGLLSVILADGINLGLKKMASAGTSHSFWELLRIGRWHVQEDAFERALAMLVEAQSALPMARFWGAGRTASSDGQFFPAGGTGEAMNLINAKYGAEPGLKAYSHVSDQYALFSTQVIPATAHEAPYILDGLLLTDAGRRVEEHYADTGGFTDHVFGLCAILGFRFTPRIKDLPHKRLYAFAPNQAPAVLRPLIAGKIKAPLIERNWPQILRLAASAVVGAIAPSQALRKLAAYPRQNELALALREVGRIERTLFMLRWLTDLDLQRRAQLGLNKGEAQHALKRAINFNRRGEIRDRTGEGQHYRIAGLNLLTAIIVYWNTWRLGAVVQQRMQEGWTPSPELLAHVSPQGWEHLILTGEYRFRRA